MCLISQKKKCEKGVCTVKVVKNQLKTVIAFPGENCQKKTNYGIGVKKRFTYLFFHFILFYYVPGDYKVSVQDFGLTFCQKNLAKLKVFYCIIR